MFTGDRSGDWLYRALHRVGFANQAASTARDDGLELNDAVVTAAVRCAPPGNKPTPAERSSCRPWLEAEFDLLVNVRVLVALGGFAHQQALRILSDRGLDVPRPRPRFSHAAEVHLRWGTGAPNVHRPFGGHEVTLLCSYHPSQQNTFTGRLTEEMFDAIWRRARELIQS